MSKNIEHILSNNHKLKSLFIDLNWNTVTEEGIQNILQAVTKHAKQIKNFGLAIDSCHKIDFKALPGILEQQLVKFNELSSMNLSMKGLVLANNEIVFGCISKILSLGTLKSFRANLTWCEITDDILNDLEELLKEKTNLSTLYLNMHGCGLMTDQCCEDFS